ncbi:heavy metal translocating P-type ATPase [Lentilactobacillus sp. SPB1-3]|uniref:Heavy metal translocating P-type ATPase n=1 Tax=Lentilactobacillus terminaliae TaxID=3003483 RepID=A0ACD5DDY6_9LACO|nr:heavy metal translocating P-type ATPase [Lentilactobacillus sp. SPB1-3]MCZ0977746.1 heavy metal translocating P-type ATPase [Lentilactobacillus sp. SPB1-3]
MAKLLNQFNKYWTQLTLWSAILLLLGFGFRVAGLTLITNTLFAIVTIIAGLPTILRAISALNARVISIELLVSIAVIGAVIIQEFEESAVVTFLFILGNFLEQRTLNRTHKSIKELTESAPKTALLLNDNTEPKSIDVDEIEVDDKILVRVGDQVPVDGNILTGSTLLDEATVTGESISTQKQPGDAVYMGTTNQEATITVKATRVGEDTTFGKIIELVEDAQDNQAPAAKFIDKFAKYYTPAVLIIAAMIFLFFKDFRLAITFLVLGCPGALVIGAPVSNVAGIGRGAQSKILVKGGSVMDELNNIDTLLFDKTGTITTGHPSVSQLYQYDDHENWLLIASQMEQTSTHPLGTAIVKYAQQSTDNINQSLDTKTINGVGITAEYNQQTIWLGSPTVLETSHVILTDEQTKQLRGLQESGNSIVLMMADQTLVIMFGIIDQLRPGVKDVLNALRRYGIKKFAMLTGDNKKNAKQIGKLIQVDDVRAELMPTDKVGILESEQANGREVLFIGDGINDAPAIAKANVGIAMGSGTDTAIETSDVVLIDSDFDNIFKAKKLARITINNMRQNIVIAIATVLVLLVGLLTNYVDMATGMFVHEASILVVILNATRILKIKL